MELDAQEQLNLLSLIYKNGKSVDAIQAMKLYKLWFKLDTHTWHDFSYALDYLERMGLLNTAGHNTDGMWRYCPKGA